jgi:hypothetical protein
MKLRKMYNDYDDLLSKLYKKEQNEKFNFRIKNVKSNIYNKNIRDISIPRRKLNRSFGNEDISKIK